MSLAPLIAKIFFKSRLNSCENKQSIEVAQIAKNKTSIPVIGVPLALPNEHKTQLNDAHLLLIADLFQ